jgi:hypothetical protein
MPSSRHSAFLARDDEKLPGPNYWAGEIVEGFEGFKRNVKSSRDLF